MLATCEPCGATVGSKDEGNVSSRRGLEEKESREGERKRERREEKEGREGRRRGRVESRRGGQKMALPFGPLSLLGIKVSLMDVFHSLSIQVDGTTVMEGRATIPRGGVSREIGKTTEGNWRGGHGC